MPSNVQAAQTLLDSVRAPTLCLYHDDPDGCCAAAIVRRMLGQRGDTAPSRDRRRHPLGGRSRQATRSSCWTTRCLWRICGRLGAGRRMVWIDHHKTALAGLSEAMADVAGERSVEAAACVLAWRTFYPGHSLPLAVELVGDRDIWQMAHPGDAGVLRGPVPGRLPAGKRWTVATAVGRRPDAASPAGRPGPDAVCGTKSRASPTSSHDAALPPPSMDIGLWRSISRETATWASTSAAPGTSSPTVMWRSSGGVSPDCGHALLGSDRRFGGCARDFLGGGGHRGAAGFQFLRAGHPFPKVPSSPGAGRLIPGLPSDHGLSAGRDRDSGRRRPGRMRRRNKIRASSPCGRPRRPGSDRSSLRRDRAARRLVPGRAPRAYRPSSRRV